MKRSAATRHASQRCDVRHLDVNEHRTGTSERNDNLKEVLESERQCEISILALVCHSAVPELRCCRQLRCWAHSAKRELTRNSASGRVTQIGRFQGTRQNSRVSLDSATTIDASFEDSAALLIHYMHSQETPSSDGMMNNRKPLNNSRSRYARNL